MDSDEKKTYESEPVYYCNSCLSLRIKCECGVDYCDDCGSTDVIESQLETWKARYRKKYGSNFIRNRQQMFDDSTDSD